MTFLTTHFNHPILVYATVLFTVLGAIMKRRRRSNPRGLPRPPGPKGYPIIGNLWDMPRMDESPWIAYDKMRETYGDMIYLEVFGQPFLVLGTLDKVRDILEKRSAIYSSRPHMPMVMDLMRWDWDFAFLPYGPRWKHDRRIFLDFFRQGVVDQYQPVLLREAHGLLRVLLESPENFLHHIRHTFSKGIMEVSYGITVQPKDDIFLETAERALKSVSDATAPGKFLVDLIPAMKYIPEWFPGAYFQRQATIWRKMKDELLDLPYDHVKQAMATGNAVPCMLTSMMETLPDEKDPRRQEEEERIKGIASIAFGGGIDTTLSAVQTFFLAMTIYPEVQKKAQRELDAVVGLNRLPVFADRPSLPYINALIKECLRWQLVVPLGLGHSSLEDDEYNGYFIPKGTIVMANSWAILHDPDAFEKPHEFIPDRYLKDGQLNPDIRDPSVAAFGFGRRLCPGRLYGAHNMFILITSTLAAFDIRAPKNEKGERVPPSPLYTTTPLSNPVPWKCEITPRSPLAARLIRESA